MRRTHILFVIVPLLSACAGAMESVAAGLEEVNATLAEASTSTTERDRSVVLTPSAPSQTVSSTLIAPGRNLHAYSKVAIDTRAFTSGILVLDVTVGPGESGASLDLLGPNTPFTKEGFPKGSLAKAYNLSPGRSVTLRHPFDEGQVFKLGAEGHWGSPVGATNTFEVNAYVIPR